MTMRDYAMWRIAANLPSLPASWSARWRMALAPYRNGEAAWPLGALFMLAIDTIWSLIVAYLLAVHAWFECAWFRPMVLLVVLAVVLFHARLRLLQVLLLDPVGSSELPLLPRRR